MKQRLAKIRLSQLSFWWFCKVMAPDFYTDDKTYLKEFCEKLQSFYENRVDNEKDILLVNLPPRHGKSRTISLFSNWVFGRDNKQKIIIGSYNAALSTLFSKSVRNCIMEVTQEKERIVYSDIFNSTKIKKGDASMNMWSLEGSYASYLATSPTGTVTGMGGTIIIIDDLVKNAYEAYNDVILDNHYEWFTKTMLSRAEKRNDEKPLIIVVGTRWSENDLSGKIESYFPQDRIDIFKKPLIYNNSVLSDNVLDLKSALNLKMQIGDDIFNANYQQECSNKKGKLYNINDIKTYNSIPKLFETIECYVDTADEGNDFLCSIIYGKLDNKAYILDILYTDEPMEITEVLVANKLIEYNVDYVTIESNNGGRGFSRQVERIINDKCGKTKVSSFHQSLNKKARIISNNTFVKNNIFMPDDFIDKYKEFSKELLNYSTSGKNKHDDGIDALTGVAEQLQKDFNKHNNKKLSKKDFLGF